jgi:hypothetical protein
MPSIEPAALPMSLLERFTGVQSQLMQCLRFLEQLLWPGIVMHMASSSSERVYVEYFLGRRKSWSYEQGGSPAPLGGPLGGGPSAY